MIRVWTRSLDLFFFFFRASYFEFSEFDGEKMKTKRQTQRTRVSEMRVVSRNMHTLLLLLLLVISKQTVSEHPPLSTEKGVAHG